MSGSSPRYQAVLLDLDGTMVDTIGDFVVAMNNTLQAVGSEAVPADVVRSWVGRGART